VPGIAGYASHRKTRGIAVPAFVLTGVGMLEIVLNRKQHDRGCPRQRRTFYIARMSVTPLSSKTRAKDEIGK
jgi:hypothetical protein